MFKIYIYLKSPQNRRIYVRFNLGRPSPWKERRTIRKAREIHHTLLHPISFVRHDVCRLADYTLLQDRSKSAHRYSYARINKERAHK